MSKTIQQIEQELDEKIPRDVISLRDGGSGRKLSYLEGHYVIDRLNKVFGHLNWTKEILDVRQVENVTSKGTYPAYLVKVALAVKVENSVCVKEAYGYGSDKSSLNAHELAIKEAVTDALKVAAKDLGMSMGLALYDKTQENVEDEPNRTDVNKFSSKVSDSKGSDKDTAPDPSKLREAITQYFKVAEAQKKITKETFKEKLRGDFKGKEKIAELDDLELNSILEFLKTITK